MPVIIITAPHSNTSGEYRDADKSSGKYADHVAARLKAASCRVILIKGGSNASRTEHDFGGHSVKAVGAGGSTVVHDHNRWKDGEMETLPFGKKLLAAFDKAAIMPGSLLIDIHSAPGDWDPGNGVAATHPILMRYGRGDGFENAMESYGFTTASADAWLKRSSVVESTIVAKAHTRKIPAVALEFSETYDEADADRVADRVLEFIRRVHTAGSVTLGVKPLGGNPT